MKEQSHKEEMSAALRGDFQRLRERGVSPALVPQPAAEPEPEPEADGTLEAVVDPPAGPPREPPIEEPPRRSWLSRLARG